MSVVAVARSLASSSPRPNGGLVDSHISTVNAASQHPSCLHASIAPNDIDFFKGPAAPTSKSLMMQRDDVVRGEADTNRSGTSQHALETNATRLIQAIVRGFLCRRQYLRYVCFVKRDLQVLTERRRHIAIVIMQRIARGFLVRRRYLKQRNLEEEKRREDAAKSKGKKKGGGGGKKAGASTAAAPPPLDFSALPVPNAEAVQLFCEAALERNQTFVLATRQLLDEAFDESLATIDAYMKTCSNSSPAEPIFLKLQIGVQRRKNISLGLPPNAPPPATPAGGAAAKKKK
jgi:hypothetical protein